MKINNLRILLTCALALFFQILFAAEVSEGYEIKVKIKDYDKDTLFLGFQMGNQFYVKDTAILDKSSGFYVFKGEKKLASGLYFLMMEKNANLCEIVISDKEEQAFIIATKKDEPMKEIRLKNSVENDIFFDYVKYLNKKTREVELTNKLIKTDSIVSVSKLKNIENDVKTYQKALISKHNKSVTGTFVKSTMEIETPLFPEIADKETRQRTRFAYYKQHYFDNVDLGNSVLLRTPTLFQKVENYVENVTPQYPDSIIQSLDRIFDLMQPSPETFQYYFLYFYNKYAKINLVGYDAITNYLALQYIEKGKCIGLINKYDSLRLVDNAKKLFPLLIGKKAPNLTTFDKENNPIELHSIKSKYTVLYFFAYDCGHCAKQSPFVAAYLKIAKQKQIDVKIITICSNPIENKDKCWEYDLEKGFNDCINTVDPYLLRQKYYDIYMTPKIFVLDENKTIRSKEIGAEQLEQVMDMLIEEDNLKLKKTVKE